MSRPISLPLFSLAYLPAALLTGCTVFVLLMGLSFATRGSPTPCADTVTAALVVTGAFLVVGGPMIWMGARALGSLHTGGLPVWTMLALTWPITLYDLLRCKADIPLPRLPPELLPICGLVFMGLSLGVFLCGTWRLTRPICARLAR